MKKTTNLAELQLFSAHFQLTGRCNLSCSFCGQRQGMLGTTRRDDLPPELFLRVADELKREAEAHGHRPEVMLWGGEPLLYEAFPQLAKKLHREGFQTGIVTNGTMLDDALAEVVNEAIDSIYISLDGTQALHNAIRGEGVFERVVRNLERIRSRRGKLTFLTTVSEANLAAFPELPEALAALQPDEIVLQQLMQLSEAEITTYREYSKQYFHCDYPELEAWRCDNIPAYYTRYTTAMAQVEQFHYSCPVRVTRHAMAAGLCPETAPCEASRYRLHVRCDGEVGFCTDYFGFSAGNVKNASLHDIFYGERAALFREAVAESRLPVCCHCPWRLQHNFELGKKA